MVIDINKVVPIPLKDKIAKQKSDIWNNEVSFSKSSFTKIVAPSGTGKTTLIHQLYGLRADYSGSISYNQTNIKNLNSNQVSTYRQKHLSIIFQDLRLLPQLTALENIQLKRLIGTPFVTEKEMYEMIETLGITHILQQSAGMCSYGEQQRIAIVRALMQPFDLLLMDEPFSHLDNANTAKAASLITTACTNRNAGIILTDLENDTHFNYSNHYYL
jgi:ABC-type lipoprotein export system ATPase subunit